MLNEKDYFEHIYELTFKAIEEKIDFVKSFNNFSWGNKIHIVSCLLQDLINTNEAWEYLSLSSLVDEWPFMGMFNDDVYWDFDEDKFHGCLNTVISVITNPQDSFEQSRQVRWVFYIWEDFQDKLHTIYNNALDYKESMYYECKAMQENYDYDYDYDLRDFRF